MAQVLRGQFFLEAITIGLCESVGQKNRCTVPKVSIVQLPVFRDEGLILVDPAREKESQREHEAATVEKTKMNIAGPAEAFLVSCLTNQVRMLIEDLPG